MEPDWPSTFATYVAQAGLCAKWQFQERGSWQSMDDNLCAVLEQVWRQPGGARGADQIICSDDKRTVYLVNNVLSGTRYRYDLAPDGSGVQRNLDTRGPARRLRRVETEPRAPVVWPGAVVIVEPPPPVLPEQHKGARVVESSEEAHSYACAELSKSLGGGFAAESLLQVEEIVNEEMAACFAAKRAAMGQRHNERWLWHGTTGDSAKKIVKNGFNRSFCGANGTVYGDGVYFASSASLSMKYATPDQQGRRYIFLCSVLCGRFAQGHRGMKEPPPLDPGRVGEVSEACPVAYTAEEAADGCTLFDSVVDRMDARAPNIIVVFNDVQAVPRYLLTIDGTTS